MQIKTGIDIADAVFIDGNETIKAVVLGIIINAHAVTYRLGWIAAGVPQEAVVDEFRLTLVDAPAKAKTASPEPEGEQNYPRMVPAGG